MCRKCFGSWNRSSLGSKDGRTGRTRCRARGVRIILGRHRCREKRGTSTWVVSGCQWLCRGPGGVRSRSTRYPSDYSSSCTGKFPGLTEERYTGWRLREVPNKTNLLHLILLRRCTNMVRQQLPRSGYTTGKTGNRAINEYKRQTE